MTARSSGHRLGDHRRLHDFYLHRRFRPGHPAVRGVERRLRVQPDGHLQDGRPGRLRLRDGHSDPGSNSEAVFRDPGDRHRHPDAGAYPHRQFRGERRHQGDARLPDRRQPGSVSGCITTTSQIINQLKNNPSGCYINVHKHALPGRCRPGTIVLTGPSFSAAVTVLQKAVTAALFPARTKQELRPYHRRLWTSRAGLASRVQPEARVGPNSGRVSWQAASTK